MRISDWSSDVCSSDLLDSRDVLRSIEHLGPKPWTAREGIFYFHGDEEALPALEAGLRGLGFAVRLTRSAPGQIGRASCRERVCQYVSISVVAVSLKKKINELYSKHCQEHTHIR